MFFTLLIQISNFVPIEYYLLYDLLVYILLIILNYKNLQFKQFVNNMAIDLLFFKNFTNIGDIKKRCKPMMDLLKFKSSKKILSKL